MDDKYTLDPRFVSEIKEFVDMALEEDFYVILCGFFWAFEVTNPDSVNSLHPIRYESVIVNAKEQKRSEKVLKAFWTQIATAFNNSYDEHLIFETMNELNMMKDFMAEVTKPGRSCSVTLHFNPVPEEDDYWCYYNTHTGEWVDEEYLDTVLYAQQGKEYPLSADFVKKNTIKVESLVGKELLAEPHQFDFWNDVTINNLTRAVPSKYKLELVVEKTGPDPRLTVN